MTCEPVESFVFYRSFLEAIGEMEDRDKLDTFQAICSYAIYGTEPVLSSPFSRAVFSLAKPSIDANKGRRANGKKGGRPPKNPDETGGPETGNHWFSERESTESESGSESGAESGAVAGAGGGAADHHRPREGEDGLGRVMTAFLDRINPRPSPGSLGQLKAYCEELGAEVCLEAIDRALDAGEAKRNWNYIRGILKSLSKQGVRCLADWKRIEENRQRGTVPCGSAGQGPLGEVEREALARMLGRDG